MATSLAEVDHHRAPNPRLRPPLPPGADGRNQRSRSSGRKRLAHLNQSLPARYICVENSSEKYSQPHCRNVVGISETPWKNIFLRLPHCPSSPITLPN